jgi:hypothetical protein
MPLAQWALHYIVVGHSSIFLAGGTTPNRRTQYDQWPDYTCRLLLVAVSIATGLGEIAHKRVWRAKKLSVTSKTLLCRRHLRKTLLGNG